MGISITRLMKNILLPFVLILTGCSLKHPQPQTLQGGDSALHADTLKSVQDDITRLSYQQRQGKYLYTKYCSVCHGEDGKGSGFNAYNCDPKPRDFTDTSIMKALSDDRIIETISGGGRSVNKSPLMPSWGGRMSKDEIRDVASYLRTFISAQ